MRLKSIIFRHSVQVFYKLSLPLVSIGKSNIAMVATKYNPPAAMIGAEALILPA